MSLLLKITDGLMKGAEVALIPGTRIKIGSDENCDIVISDSVVAAVVCELDVREDDVVVILPDGRAEVLAPFTICSLESLAFAVGPDDEPWQELQVKKTAEESVEEESAEEEKEAVEEEKQKASVVVTEPGDVKVNNRRCWHVILILLVVFLVAVLAFLQLKKTETFKKLRSYLSGEKSKTEAVEAETGATLEQLASEYHLEIGMLDERPVLKGNFSLATERLAVRALALKINRNVLLDLTDDQTLLTAAEALLFTLTEGQVSVAQLKERSASFVGKLASEKQLAFVLEAFRNDLPVLKELDVSGIMIPQPVKNGMTVNVQQKPASISGTVIQDNGQNMLAESKVLPNEASLILIQNLPIAGILMTPYPCVVLKNGTRCMVGAQIGNAVLEKIEADKLSLRLNHQLFFWHP